MPRVLRPMRHPEPALVGKFQNRSRLLGQGGAHRVRGVRPAGGGEILQYLRPVWQMHESPAGTFLFEIAIAEFQKPGILLISLPAAFFQLPKNAFGARTVAIVRCEEEWCPRRTHAVKFPQRRATVLAAGNLHHPIEHEQSSAEVSVRPFRWCRWRGLPGRGWTGGVAHPQSGRVGVPENDCLGRLFDREAASLVDEFFGEIERGQIAKPKRPQPERYPSSAAASFNERRRVVGEILFDQPTFREPKAHFMSGPRVVDDGEQIVEITANGLGRNFRRGRLGGHGGNRKRGGW